MDRATVALAISGLAILLTGCGSGNGGDGDPLADLLPDASGEYSAAIQILRVDSVDETPTKIQVELPNGNRIELKLGPGMDLLTWDKAHLEGHQRVCLKIAARFALVKDSLVAVALSE